MAGSEYRFMPWARRGLAVAVNDPDPGGIAPLALRAGVHVDVAITNAGSGGTDLTLFGPGDVIGVDPRIIVRTEPRANSTNFEPNYLASLEFDPPDFPWMFTPAGAAADKLRPWVVLVVVEQKDGVTIKAEPGAPLPVLQIKAPAAAHDELPDPVDSWMWAHGQALMEQGDTTDLGAELAQHPNTNVSRLVCPRRLRAGAHYSACVVPAFAAGRDRGLGLPPDANATTTAPAWTKDQSEIRLPVYFHWDFATGPQGDFESLAARLKPFECPPEVGTVPMHIGAAGPGLALPENADGSIVAMDGALHALSTPDAAIADIPQTLRDGLEGVLDAANAHATTDGNADAPPVGPPIYGEWHAARHTIPADGTPPVWLRTLNVDPRTRIAGGLGAEIVRRNQEDFAQKAWEQVGRILDANRLLNTARLALEAARRVHVRNIRALPDGRALQLTAPLHARVPFDGVALPAAVRMTSLPDAATRPALRRMLSPQRDTMKHAMRAGGRAAFAPALVPMLAAGTPAVDPTRFIPDGIVGTSLLGRLDLQQADVSLAPLGIDGTLPSSRVKVAVDDATQAQAAVAAGPLPITLRPDLRTAGLVTKTHLAALQALVPNDASELHTATVRLVATAASRRDAATLLVSRDPQRGVTVDALDVGAGGAITVRTPPNVPNVSVGTIDPRLAPNALAVRRTLGALPAGTFDRVGNVPVTIAPGPTTTPVITRPQLPPAAVGAGAAAVAGVGAAAAAGAGAGVVSTNTVPLLVTDAGVVGRFEQAFTAAASRAEIGVAPVAEAVVPFDIAAAKSELVTRTDPNRTVRPRVMSMLSVGRAAFAETLGAALAPTFDRVMAYPEFDVAAYRYLVDYDQQRFCPGIDIVPPDSVSLLETNPRFVESFMVGLNHEMNRELLWRAYPGDLRGTPFQKFWDRTDGKPDMPPIHEFSGAIDVGGHLTDTKPKLVLLVRGELLRRYPTAVVYAIPAVRVQGNLRMSTDMNLVQRPIFHGWFDPDATFYGFALEEPDLQQGDGWFFVLQEQPTEPRFGLDDPPSRTGPLTSWDAAAWDDTGVAADQHLGLTGMGKTGLFVDMHSGAIADALYQRPMRIAVHAKHLAPKPG